MIHVAIAGQWDRLDQSQNSRHVRHGQLLIHGALTLRFPNEGHCYGYENREKPLHLFSRSKFDFQLRIIKLGELYAPGCPRELSCGL